MSDDASFAHPHEVQLPQEDNLALDPGISNDDLPTPRASLYGATPASTIAELSSSEELTMDEDYFNPPLSPHPSTTTSPSQLLSLQSAAVPGASGVVGAAPGLQSKATIAISLPEGVYAEQQDGVRSTGGSGSVTTAPSFSDSTSVKSYAPTISTTAEHDVESMLSEILEENEARFGSTFIEDLVDETEEEEENENDLRDDDDGLGEEEQLVRWRAKRKHFFILSQAGKPVYSRYGNETIISSYIGVIQAIISFFADSSDTLQSFESGTHRFAVTNSGPLYLVAISSIGETPAQLRSQLDALYQQILSTLTLSQLTKVFNQRYNFDLRRLLGGTEVFLDGLVDSMTRGSPQVLLSALECVKIRKSYRERINNILLKARCDGLLYGLIVADGRLVSVVRPKRHSLHPPDLQLLFSMLFNSNTFRDGNEHWTPICMPKFNSKGFLHAYINFFEPEICVVLISANKDAFFEMREMAASVIGSLKSSSLLSSITAAIPRYVPTDIVPGTPIRHFLYRSRQNVQFTMPAWGSHYTTRASKRRVMTLYHKLHAGVHQKSAHLKVCFCSRKQEEALAWVLPAFELYVVAGPGAKREAIAKGAQRIAGWVKGEEERLFVIGGATF